MRSVPFEEVRPANWDALVDESSDAWLFHRSEWIAIEGAFAGEECRGFGIEADNRLLAVQPLYLRSLGLGRWTERLLHSGLHRHTGLAIAPGASAAEVRAARSLAMQRIESLADSLDVDRIQLNAHNLAPTNMTAERLQLPFWVSDFGYQPGLYYGPNGLQPLPSLSTPAADQIVDLRFSEEHLFARLQESARRAVRKAEKHALGVRASRAMEDVPRYYELARRSAVRTGESLAPLEYFCRIVEVFQDAPRAMLLFVSHGDNDAAALLLLVYKQGATFLGGVSDPEYLEMRINDLLHWSAIRLLREQGVRYYRLGPWFPTVPPDWPIAKVSKFKSKFGGLHIPIVEGTKFRRPRRYLEDALQELRARYAGPVVACPGT